MTTPLFWIVFIALVLALLVLDLLVFQRRAHAIKFKEALLLSLFWIGLAFAFNIGVYVVKGPQKALEFLTGYLIEESLSVDNLFVFIMIFSYFHVDAKYQHKILFWGILGAMVMRAVFILTGVALINKFQWIIYLFGAFLIFTGIKIGVQKETEIHPEKNIVLRLFRRFFPVSHEPHEGKFFLKTAAGWAATPLFVVLLVVETTDVVFAVDSIPAILAISRDPFIVYTSNVFAILGLRSLYFALVGVVQLFHYFKIGLSLVLVFVGAKMILSHFYKIPIGVALGTVAAILGTSVLASILFPKKVEPVKVD